MSGQIVELAPATRVASRKLGPVAGISPPSPRARAACADQDVREDVRQVRDARHHAVVQRRVDRRRLRADPDERPVQALVERSGRRGPGVRYHVAPSKRSARACSTPEVSAPASGWPPMKRGSSRAPTTARLVEPTSRDGAVGRRARPAPRRPRAPSAATGAATKTSSAPSTALGDARRGVLDRPARERRVADGGDPGRSR